MRVAPGEHMRVFPLSDWTELDVWQYIAAERIELAPLYYAHPRRVAIRGDAILGVAEAANANGNDELQTRIVRFRTVGDISCTLPVESEALTPEEVVRETLSASLSERGATRLDDRTSEASMEARKRAGYF
jgi:sulfate adenylyltransferase subunit 2